MLVLVASSYSILARHYTNEYDSIVIMMQNKNDDYYTVSNDTSILNDESSVNDKPWRRFNNVFTKFMIRMLAVIIWIILTGIIFGSIIALMYYINFFVKSATIILGAVLGLLVAAPIIGLAIGALIYFITDKVNIITNHILDKLENDDDN